MVHAELAELRRENEFCFLCFFFFSLVFFLNGSLTFSLSRPTRLHHHRLSPAASAPASSSPAAHLPTRRPSARRWRSTVCWWWISTPSKVRPPRTGRFLLDLAGAGAWRGATLRTAPPLEMEQDENVDCDQNDYDYHYFHGIIEMCSKKKVLVHTLKSFYQVLF